MRQSKIVWTTKENIIAVESSKKKSSKKTSTNFSYPSLSFQFSRVVSKSECNMTEKAGKGINADEDIDIQISMKIPADFQAENPRDISQSSIMISCISNI